MLLCAFHALCLSLKENMSFFALLDLIVKLLENNKRRIQIPCASLSWWEVIKWKQKCVFPDRNTQHLRERNNWSFDSRSQKPTAQRGFCVFWDSCDHKMIWLDHPASSPLFCPLCVESHIWYIWDTKSTSFESLTPQCHDKKLFTLDADLNKNEQEAWQKRTSGIQTHPVL